MITEKDGTRYVLNCSRDELQCLSEGLLSIRRVSELRNEFGSIYDKYITFGINGVSAEDFRECETYDLTLKLIEQIVHLAQK